MEAKQRCGRRNRGTATRAADEKRQTGSRTEGASYGGPTIGSGSVIVSGTHGLFCSDLKCLIAKLERFVRSAQLDRLNIVLAVLFVALDRRVIVLLPGVLD